MTFRTMHLYQMRYIVPMCLNILAFAHGIKHQWYILRNWDHMHLYPPDMMCMPLYIRHCPTNWTTMLSMMSCRIQTCLYTPSSSANDATQRSLSLLHRDAPLMRTPPEQCCKPPQTHIFFSEDSFDSLHTY